MVIAQAHRRERGHRFAGIGASESGRQLDLLPGPEVRHEVVGWVLEDDADVAPPHPSSPSRPQRSEIVPLDLDEAGTRPLAPREGAQQ